MGLGDYVKKKRLAKGMSQRRLSVLSGLSNSEISRIEAGERQNPSPAVLRSLASALDLPYEEILSLAGYLPPEGAPSVDVRLPKWVHDLPPDLYDFVRDDAGRDWQYVRMAKGISKKDLDPAEIEALLRTWVLAKRTGDRSKDEKSEE